MHPLYLRLAVVCLGGSLAVASGQGVDPVVLRGEVLDPAGQPVAGASVWVEGKAKAQTDASGAFQISGLPAGTYQISAEKAGEKSRPQTVVVDAKSGGEPRNLRLEKPGIEFADEPKFAIAGVTDWTAAGGHGSDSTLRTSEELAREALALDPNGSARAQEALPDESKLRAELAASPGNFAANHKLGALYLKAGRYAEAMPFLLAAYRIQPDERGNELDLAEAYAQTGEVSQAREHAQSLLQGQKTAALHHLLGVIDEKEGDSVAAVREDELAVQMDPTEANYFAWGSELLLHRAVWEAAQVFQKGSVAYPNSVRMLTGLGAAQFAGALYEQAAVSLCQASDLRPSDAGPYLFLGQIEAAAPKALPCIEPRLVRFLEQEPENPMANYYRALDLLKRNTPEPGSEDYQRVESLLKKAVALDPKCAPAYLQLGILSFSRRQTEPAIESFLQAIRVDPRLSEAHYRLAVAYDRAGLTDKAKEEFAVHERLEKEQAAAVERQRREVKQFQVVSEGQPGYPTPSR
jgi:tetratricopeptide (TPR) repeat protein